MLRGWKESGLTEAHFRHERLSQAFHRGIGLSARHVFRLMRAAGNLACLCEVALAVSSLSPFRA